MIDLQDSPLYSPEVERRIAAFSTMDFNQVDRNLEGVLGYIQGLYNAGAIDRPSKEVVSQKANQAAMARKVELEAENASWLGFQVIFLCSIGVGALLFVTYVNYLSVQNASILVFVTGIALAIYGLGFVATRAIRSLCRK